MNPINSYLEHTVLKQGLSENTIGDSFEFCVKYEIPTLVIPPSSVKYASSLIKTDKISICTLIGFPLGFNTFSTKLFEIEDAIFNGADEIDLVLDNSIIKNNDWNKLNEELSSYRKTCEGKILKIIVETSLLQRDELEKTAGILVKNGIDFIKTSTGMVGDGAKIDDVRFLKDTFGNSIKIKASGGIKTKEQVLDFISAGADRIGTSSAKSILEN